MLGFAILVIIFLLYAIAKCLYEMKENQEKSRCPKNDEDFFLEDEC